ncbi:MAG: acyltransferase family protein [Deltaproteobacteria bacterium]|nr:acyltransferase family protein [Deltaproteobacteria bacterium]
MPVAGNPPPSTEPASRATRLAFLDVLRAVGTLSIVAAHGIVPYMVNSPAHWYVHDTQRWIAMDALGLVAEATLIPLLLFVAGLVTPGSLLRHGPRGFLLSRSKRLLLPFFPAILVVVPFAYWLRSWAEAPPHPGALEVWKGFFGWDLNHGHLWFLPYLLVLGAAAALASKLRPHALLAALRSPPSTAPAAGALVLFALGIGLAKAGLLLVYGDQVWFDSPLLNVQPTRIPLNVGFFLLGMCAAFGRWHEGAPAGPRRLVALGVATLLLAAALVANAAVERPPVTPGHQLLDGIFHGGVATSSVLFFFELLRSRVPVAWSPGRTGRSLVGSSFTIYLVHYIPVMGVGFLMRRWPLHPGLKLAIVVPLAVGASWLLALVLRRAPRVRSVLG